MCRCCAPLAISIISGPLTCRRSDWMLMKCIASVFGLMALIICSFVSTSTSFTPVWRTWWSKLLRCAF